MPIDVENSELREKLKLRIWQMIMDPPRQRAPVGPFGIELRKPWKDNAGGCAHAAFRIAPVPDVAGTALLIGGAIKSICIAESVDGAGALGGANCDMTERHLQRLQQVTT